jgi:8-oxo-dGTP diphosphatase
VTRVTVVAAVIERDGRMLLGLRPPEKRHGGLWEFPGGKVDPGESTVEAIHRELSEELGLDVSRVDPLLESIEDTDSPFVIEFYPVSVTGEPSALEHTELGWFTVDELLPMPLAPADAAFASWLSNAAGS